MAGARISLLRRTTAVLRSSFFLLLVLLFVFSFVFVFLFFIFLLAPLEFCLPSDSLTPERSSYHSCSRSCCSRAGLTVRAAKAAATSSSRSSSCFSAGPFRRQPRDLEAKEAQSTFRFKIFCPRRLRTPTTFGLFHICFVDEPLACEEYVVPRRRAS